MNSRDEQFLHNIRTRLGDRTKVNHPGPWRGSWAGHGTEYPQAGSPIAADLLVDRFTTELAAVGGYAERVTTPAQLLSRLEDLRGRLNLEQIVCDDLTEGANVSEGDNVSESASWIAAIESLGLIAFATDAETDALAGADAGITWADWGIAETGSIVLSTDSGRSRLVSLLPWVHVALLPLARLVATRGEVLTNMSLGSDHWPTNVVIVTGPSRTADIENDLSIGVHGPGHVHVFILG